MKVKVKLKSLSCVRLFATLWTVAHQASPSMGFSRQEYWRGLPFPSPGDLPNPGIEPGSPALQANSLPTELQGKPIHGLRHVETSQVLVAQSCPTLRNPMDCSPPGSSVHGILQARILEWVAIPFFRGSSQPRGRTRVSHIVDRFFTVRATWEAPKVPYPSLTKWVASCPKLGQVYS